MTALSTVAVDRIGVYKKVLMHANPTILLCRKGAKDLRELGMGIPQVRHMPTGGPEG